MSAPALRAPAEMKKFRREPALRTVRVLIRMSGGSAFLPARAHMVITSGSGAPFAEVALNWEIATDDEAALRAVLEALKIARRYRAQRVVVYIDNEVAASVAAGEEKASPALVGLALQIRALAHTYKAVEVRYGMSLIAPTLPAFSERAAPRGDENYACDLMSNMGDEAQEWTS